jgi:uncharacterized alpha-E superfamily protein
MHTSNTNVIGRKLDEMDRQIHTCLKDIRKNLKELEQVSGSEETARATAAKSGGDKRFSSLLKAALQDQEPPGLPE